MATPDSKKRLPRKLAQRLADEKAIAAQHKARTTGIAENALVLSADTVVAVGRRILPKAEDEATARKCLELLSGRRHRVFSAIALKSPDGTLREKLSETNVRFKRLSKEEIAAYLATGEPFDKAGAYGIQGGGAVLVDALHGSYSGVVGLPLTETRQLLHWANVPYWKQ